MNIKLSEAWKALLGDEFEKPYFRTLTDFVRGEYVAAADRKGPPVYPAARNIFRALDHCEPSEIKVVIIGQDPYHGPGQANGLCFSVNDGVPHPPSLRNIFKEIADDLGVAAPASGNLDRWAEQGVLLLNASLTVREGQPNSHADKGWQTFTDAVVAALGEAREGIVYMLWGAFAQRKGERLDGGRNLILKAAHPSPLSAHNGFFGCRHFSRANEYLVGTGKTPITW
jgi:uracil-DNA glycosylase